MKIQNNVSVYEGITIEDEGFVDSSVFTNVINPRSNIERKDEFKKTIIRKGASIGANAQLYAVTTLRILFYCSWCYCYKGSAFFCFNGGVPLEELAG